MSTYTYRADQELPAMALEWLDRDGTVIDFSTDYNFTVQLTRKTQPTTVVATKTTGVTGAATSPNVLIDWSTSDFSGLTAEDNGTTYLVHVTARRTADSKDRVFSPGSPPQLVLKPALS